MIYNIIIIYFFILPYIFNAIDKTKITVNRNRMILNYYISNLLNKITSHTKMIDVFQKILAKGIVVVDPYIPKVISTRNSFLTSFHAKSSIPGIKLSFKQSFNNFAIG